MPSRRFRLLSDVRQHTRLTEVTERRHRHIVMLAMLLLAREARSTG